MTALPASGRLECGAGVPKRRHGLWGIVCELRQALPAEGPGLSYRKVGWLRMICLVRMLLEGTCRALASLQMHWQCCVCWPLLLEGTRVPCHVTLCLEPVDHCASFSFGKARLSGCRRCGLEGGCLLIAAWYTCVYRLVALYSLSPVGGVSLQGPAMSAIEPNTL
jgi:hypothetical protein